MTQRDRLRDLDAEILGVLADTGFVDAATFRQKGSTEEVDCTVLVDRGVSLQGGNGAVVNDQIVITSYLADIDEPKVGAEFDVGDETFRVERITAKDESRVVCVVRAAP